MREKDAYAFLVNDLGATGRQAEEILETATKQGWTLYHEVGKWKVCAAKVPSAALSRSEQFQITVK